MDKTKYHSFHITFAPASGCGSHWPNGMWALYCISGDEIARRVEFGLDGKAARRDSWSGYRGGFHSLADLMAAIESGEDKSCETFQGSALGQSHGKEDYAP